MVPRQPAAETRAEIRAVAGELFAQRGFEQTSLREIAERLGITKAALYYHFPSKNELMSSLVQPLVDELRALAEAVEATAQDGAVSRDPRPTVLAYYDICVRHRQVLRGLIRDVHAIRELDILPVIVHWRERVDAVLVGSDDPADRVRAVVALGGLQDTVAVFDDDELARVREAAIEAAMRALLPG
ncbi:TetR/AcrR family transcriptional regulator [Pseudonocardia sp. CA-107938]|uniref:TetR/AcrR family transcriptional regulator n=1 Tax=Pseudonocardia sp. CA-107938 TaxID=3240021 RepID=UPI003D945E03